MSARTLDLAALYSLERGRLHRLIKRIVGNRAIAEDLTQDTYIKLHTHSVGAADRGLLFRTAQNLALDHLRGQRVRDGHARAVLMEQQAGEERAPDHVLAARQELQALLSALEALPKRTQQIFLLSKLDGMSHPQIAKALDVSVSTVEKDMVRAISFCRTWQKNRDRE